MSGLSSTLEDSFSNQQNSLMKLTQGLCKSSRTGVKRNVMEHMKNNDPKNGKNGRPMKKRRQGDTEEEYSDNEMLVQDHSSSAFRHNVANARKTKERSKKVPEGNVGIEKYLDNDVLCGRGGGTNAHPGNKEFRDMINIHRHKYLKARKNDKPAISRSIVQSIREKNGRFLKKDEKTGLYYEIGDDNAREKTSQALRQRASQFRQVLIHSENETTRKSMQNPHDIANLQRFLTQSDCSSMGNYYSPESSQSLKFNIPNFQQNHLQQQSRGVHLSLSQLNSALTKNSTLMDQLNSYQESSSGSFPLSLSPNNNGNSDPLFFNSSISRNSMMNLPQSFLRNHPNSSVLEKKMRLHHMSSIPHDFDMNPQFMYLQQQIPLWTTATLLGRGRNSMTNHTA